MIVAIDNSNIEVSLELLVRGFSRNSRDFWKSALERLQNFSGNQMANVPIGYMMVVNERPCGIVLTPASCRVNSDGTLSKFINLSNWYIEPKERWRAAMMMRAVLKDKDAIYTDVSPAPGVEEILEGMGFDRLNDGQTIIATPYAALFPSGHAKMFDLNMVPPDAIGEELWALLMEHTEMECVGACLFHRDRPYPLLFKFVSKLGLPMAELVYCASNEVLLENLSIVSRYLLRKSRVLLRMDIPRGGRVPGVKRRGKGVKFAKGLMAKDTTDYLGTEYSLFDYKILHFVSKAPE